MKPNSLSLGLRIRLISFSAVIALLSAAAHGEDPPPAPTHDLMAEEGEPSFSGSTYSDRAAVEAAVLDFVTNPAYSSGPYALTFDNPEAPDVLRLMRSGGNLLVELEVYSKLVPGVLQTTYQYELVPSKPLYVTGTRTDALGDARLAQLKTQLDATSHEYQELWFVNYGWPNELRAYYHAVHIRFAANASGTPSAIMVLADTILEFDYSQETKGYLSEPE